MPAAREPMMQNPSAMPNARFKSRRDFAVAPKTSTVAPPRGRKPAIDFAAIPSGKPGSIPAVIAPALATLVKAVPAGGGLMHEMK